MNQEIAQMRTMFQNGSKCIAAIGDETRQLILLTLMEGDCSGMRVGEITKGTHLSQPAVSHHLKILCDAKILTVRKEGTMNFYQMNPDKEEIINLYLLFGKILKAINNLEAERNKK